MASCMVLGEALSPALFLPLFSTGKMVIRIPTAGVSLKSVGFGDGSYIAVTGVGC